MGSVIKSQTVVKSAVAEAAKKETITLPSGPKS